MSESYPWQTDIERIPSKHPSLVFQEDSLPQLGKFIDVVFTAIAGQVQLLDNQATISNIEAVIDAIFPSKLSALLNKNGRRFISASKAKISSSAISFDSLAANITASEDCLRFICGVLDFLSEYIIEGCSKLRKQVDSQVVIACLVNDKEIQSAWARCASM